MTLPSLRGIFAPVTTPFKESGEIDRAALEFNLRSHIQNGLHGIVLAGSTGEAPLLDEREREQLVEWARPWVPNERILIAGVGAESTRTTLKYTESAAERGVDAVLVVAPHYFGGIMTQDALRAHYLRVADESPVPVLIYNMPKYMHFSIAPSLVQELSRHENVIGMKDSTGQREAFQAYLQAQDDHFSVMTGNGTFVKTALEMGGTGAIVTIAVFAASALVALWEAMQRGDHSTGDAIQNRLMPLAKTIVGEMGPPGIKAALDIVGLKGGAPRPPLLPLSRAEWDRVRALFRDAELSVAA